jgi:hypothetical protein
MRGTFAVTSAVIRCLVALELVTAKVPKIASKILKLLENFALRKRLVKWLTNFMGGFLQNLIMAIIIRYLLG